MNNITRAAKKKYTLNSAETSKQIATSGGITLKGVLATGGGSSVAVRIIDSANGSAEAGTGPGNFLVAANTGESSYVPCYVQMEKGLYIELEQGAAQNGEATVFYD